MKKILTVLLAIAVTVLGGLCFTACGGGDGALSSLQLSHEGGFENCDIRVIVGSGKATEFEIEAFYGTPIDLDKLIISAVYENATKVLEENAETGYTKTSNFPDKNAPAGDYLVTYAYKDCTLKLSIKINKFRVAVPMVDSVSGGSYVWTGESITPELPNWDEAYPYFEVKSGEIPKTDIGDYSIELELRDKANTVWDMWYEEDNYISDNQIIEWYITKNTIVVDLDEFITDGASFENETFVYDSGEHAFPVDMTVIQDFLDGGLIEVSYTKNGQPFEGTPSESGNYAMIITVTDFDHYDIKWKQQSTNPGRTVRLLLNIEN